MFLKIKNSYDYTAEYDDYESDTSSEVESDTESSTDTATPSETTTNGTTTKLRKINSASSILGLNVLLTPDLDSYFGDFKQSNSEGFRVGPRII